MEVFLLSFSKCIASSWSWNFVKADKKCNVCYSLGIRWFCYILNFYFAWFLLHYFKGAFTTTGRRSAVLHCSVLIYIFQKIIQNKGPAKAQCLSSRCKPTATEPPEWHKTGLSDKETQVYSQSIRLFITDFCFSSTLLYLKGQIPQIKDN